MYRGEIYVELYKVDRIFEEPDDKKNHYKFLNMK
jgi:hypothetical protein